jgi:hypothetical protein
MTLGPKLSPKTSAVAGSFLLLLPSLFVGTPLVRRTLPGLFLVENPILLLGTLLAAIALNCLSIMSLTVKADSPSVLTVSAALRFWNLVVICAAGMLLTLLLGYAFVENFQLRPNG